MAGTTLVDRALIRLSGEEAGDFLQGIVTNDVAALAPGRPLWSGLLTAQGKVLFDFILWADGADILIDCERACAGDLARRLTLYRLRRQIVIDREPILCVHWSLDRNAGPADPRLANLGSRWLAPASDPPEQAEAVAASWRNHRLLHGVTEGMDELGNGTTLWLECNAAELNGVSFTKGCYVGQENTARMNYRGKVNRRLVVAPYDAQNRFASDAPGKRTRIQYPDLSLAVEHRRIDDLGDALIPDWLAPALAGG